MNRVWVGAVVGLVWLAVASPAIADMSLPPARYDIGGTTEGETIALMTSVFGFIPLYRVRFGEAKAKCDEIELRRYGMPYPASETPNGAILTGCLIRNYDLSDPEIVYSYDPDRPWLADQLLRHEIGHQLGWSGQHER